MSNNTTMPHIHENDIIVYAEKAFGINPRRTKITFKDPHESRLVHQPTGNLVNTVATPMFDVIRKFGSHRANTEFHLVGPNHFHVYVAGDFGGEYRYKSLNGKWVHLVKSDKIRRERSYSGVDNNEEFSSNADTVVKKMNEYLSVYDYSKLRYAHEQWVYWHFNASNSPNYKVNTVHDRDYIKIIDTWAYNIHSKFNTPQRADDEVLSILMYQLFLEKDLLRNAEDWDDEEPYNIAPITDLIALFPDIQKFRHSFERRMKNRMRAEQMKKLGWVVRINRADRIQVADMVQHPMNTYDSFEHLQRCSNEAKIALLSETMHTLKAAGPGVYVPHMGMLLCQEHNIDGTMLWLSPERVMQISAAGISIPA